MMLMTIDEAIAHALEMAEQNEKKAEYRPRMDYYDEIESRTDCLECAADHRQLAEWLMELKDLRAEQYNQYTFIRELMDELEEAKRLLKAAVEDIHELLLDRKDIRNSGQGCNVCNYIEHCNCCESCTVIDELKVWRYADEALKLIGDESNEI